MACFVFFSDPGDKTRLCHMVFVASLRSPCTESALDPEIAGWQSFELLMTKISV